MSHSATFDYSLLVDRRLSKIEWELVYVICVDFELTDFFVRVSYECIQMIQKKVMFNEI